MKTGHFLDRDAIAKPRIPSTWQKEVVGIVYLLDVAPWWYLSDLEQALGASIQTSRMADRVCWNVGEMCTAAWRITGDTIAKVV